MPSLWRTAYAAILLAATTSAHNIQLRAHERECFHENLHKEDRMTVTYQVGDREFGGSGNLEIDFWVSSPHETDKQDKRDNKEEKQEPRNS